MHPQGPVIETEYGNNMGMNVLQDEYKTIICFHSRCVFTEAPVRFWKEHCGALKQLRA